MELGTLFFSCSFVNKKYWKIKKNYKKRAYSYNIIYSFKEIKFQSDTKSLYN